MHSSSRIKTWGIRACVVLIGACSTFLSACRSTRPLPKDYEVRYAGAVEACAGEKWQQSVDVLQQLVGEGATTRDVCYRLGYSYMMLQSPDAAFDFYTHAVRKSTRDARLFLARGDLFVTQGNLYSAIEDYTRAVEADPRCAEAYVALGLAYFFAHEVGPSAQNLCGTFFREESSVEYFIEERPRPGFGALLWLPMKITIEILMGTGQMLWRTGESVVEPLGVAAEKTAERVALDDPVKYLQVASQFPDTAASAGMLLDFLKKRGKTYPAAVREGKPASGAKPAEGAETAPTEGEGEPGVVEKSCVDTGPDFWIPAVLARSLLNSVAASSLPVVARTVFEDIGALKRPVWSGAAVPISKDNPMQGYAPGYARVYRAIGQYCMSNGLEDGGVAAYVIAAMLDPVHPLPYTQISLYMADRGRGESAEAARRRQKAKQYGEVAAAILEGRPLNVQAAQADPAEWARSWLMLVLHYVKLDDLASAKRALHAALLGDPACLERDKPPAPLVTGEEAEWNDIPAWTADWVEELVQTIKAKEVDVPPAIIRVLERLREKR
ncbi:MAG: tetratricopeptide repeat protein [Planctomycetota bacterium]|nr:tetratricopeptide repeat protein [Planctomycetota bacterium]